ncbi:hypothetical protein GCM10017056_19060 [Seohaeicola zhoushanensis]|uniref:Ankyrin repeat domain-containing protein n=2 Tax=Seohaeicola zhoushanensis TaxID=1569283 RepID=A0A8J3GW91_9RHOB|nr:hypothetical protein GCM10017056_19060 [Seohaeicola zhoushanensis]
MGIKAGAVALLASWGGSGMADDARLLEAAATGDVAAIRSELAAGTGVDARDARGRTALLVATHHDQLAAARALVEAGADVNAKDDIQDSPYLYAGAEGRLAILKLTLAHGADLASTNRYGGTALIPAAERQSAEVVQVLIEAGVALDHVNKLGWTALLEAVLLGDGGPERQAVVRALIDAGADVTLADGEGVTPLGHARARGYGDIARMLEAAGARQ